MSEPELRTYYWDFFGPRAEPTAAHFKRHLQGFLEQHGIGQLVLVSESRSALHQAVGLETPPAHRELIEKALRPKRHVTAPGA